MYLFSHINVENKMGIKYTECLLKNIFGNMYVNKYIFFLNLGIFVGTKNILYKKLYNLRKKGKMSGVDTPKRKWYCFAIPF